MLFFGGKVCKVLCIVVIVCGVDDVFVLLFDEWYFVVMLVFGIDGWCCVVMDIGCDFGCVLGGDLGDVFDVVCMMYVDVISYMFDDILVKVDCVVMVVGFEICVLFFDYYVVVVVVWVLIDCKIVGIMIKYVLC